MPIMPVFSSISLSLRLLHVHLESPFKIFTPSGRGQTLSSSSPNSSFNYQELIKSIEGKTGTQAGTWGQECLKGHTPARHEGSEGSKRSSHAHQLLLVGAAEPASLLTLGPPWWPCWRGIGYTLVRGALMQTQNLSSVLKGWGDCF